MTAMRKIADRLDAEGRPLRGVVHAAMHLDDDLLLDLDQERMAAVMRPKIGGAMVLDQLTRARACDLFLLYSSASTVFGNIKQGPYAAGNHYLDALARARRADGRPALAVAWGAMREVGYVARNDLTAALSAVGLDSLSLKEALTASETLLYDNAESACVMRANWSRMRGLFTLVSCPRLASLAPAHSSAQNERHDLRDRLKGLSPQEALNAVTQSLIALIAEVLQMDPTDMDPHRRVDSYGMDSLMATELLVKIQGEYGVDIPPMELLRSTNGSLADLARTVYLSLGHTEPSTPLPAMGADLEQASAAALPSQREAASEAAQISAN